MLRATRRRLQTPDAACTAEDALALAIEAVRSLTIPHLELVDDVVDGQVVH
jgi:hypothetical protein